MKVVQISILLRQDQDHDHLTFISRPRPFFMSSGRIETKTKVSRQSLRISCISVVAVRIVIRFHGAVRFANSLVE